VLGEIHRIEDHVALAVRTDRHARQCRLMTAVSSHEFHNAPDRFAEGLAQPAWSLRM
jgi:hypothetical protein